MNMLKKIKNIKLGKFIYYFLSVILIASLVITCFAGSVKTASAAEKQTDVLINEIQYRIDESLKTEGAYL